MHSSNTAELDETTIQYIAEVQRDMQQAQMAAAQPYAQRMQGALQLYIRREGLAGQWELQPDGKTLTRTDVSATPQQTQ